MTPAVLLRALADRGIRIAWGERGRPRLVDPERQLTHIALLRLIWDRWLLEGAVVGSLSGHRWHGCSACGQVQLLHAVKANEGRPCRLTFGCKGQLSVIPVVVPMRPRPKKVKVPRVPLGLIRLLPGSPSKKSKSGKREPARPARPGDALTLVECDIHRGPRWVTTPLLSEWTCGHPADIDNGGEGVECGLPPVVLGTGVLDDVGVTTPDGAASPSSLVARLRSSLEDARNRKEAS